MIRAVLATLPLLIGAAAAQERPPTVPTRDVDVTYRVGQGASMEQRTRWQVSEQRMRIDTPTPGVYMIVDYASRRMSLVSDADRGVLELPAKDGAMPGSLAGPLAGSPPGNLLGQAARGARASFERVGTARIAGLGCTEWQTLDSQGAATTACITEDGVLLRARQGAQVLAEAARVAYGPLDPAAFRVPDGYARATRPEPAR